MIDGLYLVPFFLLKGEDEEHKSRGILPGRVSTYKEIVCVLLQDNRREGPKRFAELDLHVHFVFHYFASRIGQNAPVAESPRTPLEAALVPANNLLIHEVVDHSVYELIVVRKVFVPNILTTISS